MEKRYQVFVSSTYEDLRDERQEVMQALLELDCIPAGMELFPAANEDQWTLIKKVIDDCDYYIVVVGGRYGSLGPEGISFTQMEYEYSIAQNKPVIAFLHRDPSSISAKKTEKSSENQIKLDAFRKLVQQKMCKQWSTPADLGSVVSRSLVKLIKNSPAIGWVKADLLPDESATEEILRLRQKIDQLQKQISDSNKNSLVNSEELSQGDDPVEIKFDISALNFQAESREERSKEFSLHYQTTWNKLFFVMSPSLINEASDRTLKSALQSLVGDKDFVEAHGLEELHTSGYTFRLRGIDESDYNTIIVQLLALNLITKSSQRKNRSVNDKFSYWSLTPYGENIMMMMRAIRKSPNA